jgi:hypothetical protein
VASDREGNFVVTWASRVPESGYNVYAQAFDSNGQFIGNEFIVNTYTVGYQINHELAMDENGNFVVVWQDGGSGYSSADGLDGSSSGIFGQRFRLTIPTPTEMESGGCGVLSSSNESNRSTAATWLVSIIALVIIGRRRLARAVVSGHVRSLGQ